MALTSSTMARPPISHPHKRPPGVEKANREKGLEGLRGKKSGVNSQPHSESTEPRHLVYLPACPGPNCTHSALRQRASCPGLRVLTWRLGITAPAGGDVQPESDNRKWSEARCRKGARWIQDIAVVPIISCSNMAVHLQWLLHFCPWSPKLHANEALQL